MFAFEEIGSQPQLERRDGGDPQAPFAHETPDESNTLSTSAKEVDQQVGVNRYELARHVDHASAMR